MPKKKLVTSDEPVISRPQRNMRAKKVFDPSDVHIPKKRNKLATKPDKATETGKKPTNVKKQSYDKSKNSIVNEHFNCSSNELFPVTPLLSPPHPSSVKRSEISKDTCFLCKVIFNKKEEIIDCPICLIRAHRECLIVDEPMWRFKLDLSPWFCKACRKNHCSKCLQDDSFSTVSTFCTTCDVGLHESCFNAYDIKPLHTIRLGMYICIPCMTLATQRVPEVEEGESSEKHLTTDDENYDNDDGRSNLSSSSSAISKSDYDVRKICLWTPIEVYNYFVTRVPKSVAEEMRTQEIDGRAALLLKRKDITSMNIKLGHALKLYREIRILQTQKSFYSVYWE